MLIKNKNNIKKRGKNNNRWTDKQVYIQTHVRASVSILYPATLKKKKKANKTTTTTKTDLVKTIPDLIHFPLRYQPPLLLRCCRKCTACTHLFKSLASPSPFVTTVQQHPPISQTGIVVITSHHLLIPTLPSSGTLQLSAFPSNRRGIGAVCVCVCFF